jgi:hypothetical protein
MKFNNINELADKMAEKNKEGLVMHIVEIVPFTLVYLTDKKGVIHSTSLTFKDTRDGYYHLIENESVDISSFLVFEALDELYKAVREYDDTLLSRKEEDDIFNIEI